MRLTAELLQASPSYLNPLKERELDLRGHKIPLIENLGIAKDQDAIDFTDNDIQQLGNFPLSPRLKTLLLARNRISNIQATIAKSIPNLSCLILSYNNLSELSDLEPLKNLDRLTHLVLIDNPLTRRENYRAFLIWRFPSVRYLDYQRVKDAERTAASKLFGTVDDPTPLAAKILGIKSRTFDVDSGSSTNERVLPTQYSTDEKARIQELIRSAKSLDEIAKLEMQLRDGTFPLGVSEDAMQT